jgi:hypothetical protein
MPLESTIPQPWATCGRREREAVGEIRRSNPFASLRRDGRRHLGFRDGATLRGAARERRPRPVRFVERGLLLFLRSRRRQRVSSGRRGGERRQHARKRRMHPSKGNHAPLDRGRVLHSVQRPVHVDRHYTEPAQAVPVARSAGHRGRANLRKQEEPAPGSRLADGARLDACSPLPQGRQRGTSEKEGGCGLRPCEESRARASARTS